ncbi:MAG: antitoxin [bacterium]|nr:antitoxin [bacterium]
MGEKKVFDQIKYQNQYVREHYDRVIITMPKGKRDIVKNRASKLGKSVSQYINDLIDEDLKRDESDE